MNERDRDELYQQVILEHNKSPRNFGPLSGATHHAEGFNPLCGDHLTVALTLTPDNVVSDVHFEGNGCAISKASASMMTQAIKGKTLAQAETLFGEFHDLVTGKLDPETQKNGLGSLKVFSGIRKFPARVKCASLSWHAVKAALEKKEQVSTE
jgi:nitrogen fixation NifU-like protein